MHTPARKLKSTRGASLLFALLVFLLCLLAGAAALTAAAANAGRYTHLESEQQQYFAVASALALLQDEMDKTAADPDGDLTVTATYVETQDWWYIPGSDPGDPLERQTGAVTPTSLTFTANGVTGTLPTLPLNDFQKLLLRNCVPDAWWTGYGVDKPLLTFPSSPVPYTIKPDEASFAEIAYPTDESYTLAMELTTGDGSAYPLRVVWSGVAETKTEAETVTESITPTPAMLAAGATSAGRRTTTTTLTCTLHWPAENRTVTYNN